MPDRLPDAMDYARQDFWTLPCEKHEKHPPKHYPWTHLQRRPMTTQERHAGWPPRSDRNIALICGWRAGLFVLNVNVKNGHDGPGTLHRLGWDRLIPRTPTIATPSGGLAYCFKPPGPDFSQFLFNTHVHQPGFEGLEFRGGDDHYQLVPPSRTTEGRYTFVEPWTLERFREQLADLPGAILQAWVRLDNRGAKNSRTFSPASDLKTRKAAQHKASTDLRTAASPPHSHDRSQSRPPHKHTPPKQELLKSGARVDITTVLSAENGKQYRGSFAYGCALHLVRLLGQPGDWLENKHTFACVLPGHREATPSARWVWQRDGSVLYHDMHVRSEQRMYWAVPEVYAAFITGTLAKLRDPSMKTWSIRLAVEAGLTEPYPIPKPVLPVDMTPLERTIAAGVWLVFACKWTYEAEKASMLGQAFLGGWCGGIPAGSVWSALQGLISRRLLMSHLDEKRRTVYLPGREWPL